ncbi:MAG: hypothetical protein GY759_15190 [Chloroflexi bacterium]|nr:hypothetical protein [Chloroflexota bacterium]
MTDADNSANITALHIRYFIWKHRSGAGAIEQPLTTVLALAGLDEGAPLLVGTVGSAPLQIQLDS